MNQCDSSAQTEPEATTDTARSDSEYVSTAVPSLRRGVESGTVTAIVGGAGLLSGLRACLTGKRKRGLARLTLGAGFLTAALVQRRSRDHSGEPNFEETDVVDTGPDADAIADEAGGVGGEEHATGEAAAEVTDTSPDIGDVESGLESDADTDGAPASIDRREIADTGVDSEDLTEAVERETGDAGGEVGTSDTTIAEESADVGGDAATAEIERLGQAAFDSQSREVPVPQQAFNRGFLAHSSTVCWGIRARDDVVLLAQEYDAIEGRDGVTYVASSEIGKDVRELPIPDAVLDHWNEVIGGGMAVTGGDDILFATTEALSVDGLLRVLPAEWADNPSA